MRLLLLLSVISVALASRYWDQWAAGNGGVHSNPVFKTTPQIRWQFNFNYTYTSGVIPIDNQDHQIYLNNGQGTQPSFWKLSWGGKVLTSWASNARNTIIGTIGARNGVVYVFSANLNKLFAINETTSQQLWNTTGLVSSSSPYSTNPLEWNEDYSVLYLSTANQIHAINALTGVKIWSTQPTAGQTYYSPLIRSTLDNTFVVKYYNKTIVKYNIADGQVVWSRTLEGYVTSTPSPPTVDNTDGSIYVTIYSSWIYKLDIDGNIVWGKQDFLYGLSYQSPILFSPEWVLIASSSAENIMKLYNTSSGESVLVFNLYQINGTRFQMFSQPLFNREQNVLYMVLFETAQLVALDTSDMFHFKVMWVLDTPFSGSNGAGPSIASDGTIFLANSVYNYPVGLVSIGCPVTKQVSSDGLTCVCATAFVASGDSCVCSNNATIPSEDGLSCVCSDDRKQLSSDGSTCVCIPTFIASGDTCVCNKDAELSENSLSCVCSDNTKQLSSNGSTCACAPAFVTSGDSCVCADDTKEPSEDGLSCVDKPVPSVPVPLPAPVPGSVPAVDSPSSKAPQLATSGAAPIGLNLLLILFILAIMHDFVK